MSHLPRSSSICVTQRDRRVIEFTYRFRLLSRNQVMALAPYRSLTRANTRLADLVRTRLLSRKRLPVYPGKGSAQALYFLGPKSAAVLDVDPPTVTKQTRQVSRWDLRQTEHVIAANQVLVDLLTSIGRSADASLLSFRTESELRLLFLNQSPVPDGWLAWVEAGRRFNCFIEVDLHHEGLIEWRKKILAYQSYAESGLHDELFGYRAFRVLVLVKSKARLENLRQIGQEAGRLFLFAEMSKVGAQEILGLSWLPASGERLIALAQA
ncbi:MAG: replication-relaxation family protein [Acidobacteria bacterium]|nr:replication-relaxation family protein [Acidobacteriota bacterium]